MRQLIGGNFKPKFVGNWYKDEEYKALSVVLYQGASYISKSYVPSGIEINDSKYWFLYSDVNIQFENLKDDFNNLRSTINKEISNFKEVIENENENLSEDLKSNIDREIKNIKVDISNQFENAKSEIITSTNQKINENTQAINRNKSYQDIKNTELSNKISSNYNDYIDFINEHANLINLYNTFFRPIDLCKGYEIGINGIKTSSGSATHFTTLDFLSVRPTTKIIMDKELVSISKNLRICFYTSLDEKSHNNTINYDFANRIGNQLFVLSKNINTVDFENIKYCRIYLETNSEITLVENSVLNAIELLKWVRYVE